MSFACALLLAALSAPADPLEPARAAFALGDYHQAEAMALAAAQAPRAGAALYLAGLARFRSGKPAEALDALDQAGRAADAPPLGAWHYNRAACLYESGRFGEAEAAFLQAARIDASLAGAALANAGFAALDGGSPDRARSLAARAREAAPGAAGPLLADLEAHLPPPLAAPLPASGRADAEYREGLSAFDAGKYQEALARFQRAAELAPADGRHRIMSGASALKLGDRAVARADFQAALGLGLRDSEAQTARDYLGALERPAASGWAAQAFAGAGVDSDPLQSGLVDLGEAPAGAAKSSPSALAAANLALARRLRPRDDLVADFVFGFDQLAYLDPAASDRSVQQHWLAASLELSLTSALRAGALVRGQLAFTGVSRFRGLQSGAGAGAWLELDEAAFTSTRASLEASLKQGLGAEFSYLGGERVDLSLTQELRLPEASFTLGYRFRDEQIGSLLQTSAEQRRPLCPEGCAQLSVDPFGYAGSTLWFSAKGSLRGQVDLEASGGLELRNYLADNALFLLRGSDQVEVQSLRRHDQRWFAGASATFRASQSVAFSLRYDFVLNSSSLGGSAAAHAADPRAPQPAGHGLSYDKQVLSVGTLFVW